MQDVNEAIKWLRDGKRIKPKNRTLRIFTTAPYIKMTHTDGSTKYSDFKPSSDYYGAGWIEVDKDENKQVEKVEIVGYGSDKTYEVRYIYFNPQCNRTLCKLTTGEVTDYPFDLSDFLYEEFEVFEEQEPLLLTIKDVELKFGRPVRIIGQNYYFKEILYENKDI